MKQQGIAAIVTLALCQFLSVAWADQATDGVSTPAAAAGTIPKLNIVWSCGNCTQNEKVIPLIEEAYRQEATKNGKVISESESADVAIVSYRQRKPGARVMLGVMAGKDNLGLKINYKGAELEASDYSANTIQGMNYLCESVAKRAYKKISETIK